MLLLPPPPRAALAALPPPPSSRLFSVAATTALMTAARRPPHSSACTAACFCSGSAYELRPWAVTGELAKVAPMGRNLLYYRSASTHVGEEGTKAWRAEMRIAHGNPTCVDAPHARTHHTPPWTTHTHTHTHHTPCPHVPLRLRPLFSLLWRVHGVCLAMQVHAADGLLRRPFCASVVVDLLLLRDGHPRQPAHRTNVGALRAS